MGTGRLLTVCWSLLWRWVGNLNQNEISLEQKKTHEGVKPDLGGGLSAWSGGGVVCQVEGGNSGSCFRGGGSPSNKYRKISLSQHAIEADTPPPVDIDRSPVNHYVDKYNLWFVVLVITPWSVLFHGDLFTIPWSQIGISCLDFSYACKHTKARIKWCCSHLCNLPGNSIILNFRSLLTA